jgi:hypothetical protein
MTVVAKWLEWGGNAAGNGREKKGAYCAFGGVLPPPVGGPCKTAADPQIPADTAQQRTTD